MDALSRRPGIRPESIKSEPEFKHPLETVPFFQRPMGSSTDDLQVGTDDVGNPVFQGRLGTYTVRVNPDQRTIREKITEAIPTVTKTIRDYLKDPKAPSPEQVIDFGKGIVQGYLETIKDVTEGKGTMGDVFGLVGGGSGFASLNFLSISACIAASVILLPTLSGSRSIDLAISRTT